MIQLTTVPTETATMIATPPLPPPPVTPNVRPNKAIEVIYQPFDHGFMIWDVEKECAYSYNYQTENHIIIPSSLEEEYPGSNRYAYCVWIPDEPVPELVIEVPDHKMLPEGKIGEVWKAFPDVREGVGFPAGDQEHYVASVRYEGEMITISCCNVAALPDGRILFCGMYSRSQGRCGLSDE